MIVLIPWGKKEAFGIILEMVEYMPNAMNVKDIFHVYDETLLLSTVQLQLIDWMAQWYFARIHTTARLFFSSDMLAKIKKSTFFLSPPGKPYIYTWDTERMLTEEQKRVYMSIVDNKEKNFLLYGVTGSGKTEIYMHLIHHMTMLGKQVLFLVPEIILTTQLWERIVQVFGKEVVMLHSGISSAKKTKIWQDIYHGQAKIIIGTRSALFYPYGNLGMIIIDEDQDASYISDSTPRYDAIEVAEKISEFSGAQLLIASGTPKVSHMYEWLQGKYEVVHLLESYM